MRTPSLIGIVALAFMLAAVAARGQSTRWSGTIDLPGMALGFSVELGADSGTITIPMQGVKDLPLADVEVADRAMRFTLKPAGAPEAAWARFEAQIAPDGATAEGTLKQAGGTFPVKLTRLRADEPPPAPARPQEPKPPFPYDAIDVTFRNEPGGATLAGTLTLPRDGGPRHPALILISGSGPQNRDEELFGHKPFLVIADHLTRQGLAVLRYDDRGVASSTGDLANATTDDFADDAQAGLDYLLSRPDIDTARIGLIGHSEGAIVAGLVAARRDDVAFVVLLAGTGVPGLKLLPAQQRLIAETSGVPRDAVDQQVESNRRILTMIVEGKSASELRDAVRALIESQTVGMGGDDRAAMLESMTNAALRQADSPWMRRFLVLDPAEPLARVRCPVLALFGEKDLQVPPDLNRPPIEAALAKAGNHDATVLVLPGLNHLFQSTTTGSPAEYAAIEETFAPAALDAMTVWLRRLAALPDSP